MLGDGVKPLPVSFLEWQVQLRAFTMEQRNGAPHAGVAPLVTVRTPGAALGVVSHSIICGLLPRDLDEKTKSWRALYESGIEDGARAGAEDGPHAAVVELGGALGHRGFDLAGGRVPVVPTARSAFDWRGSTRRRSSAGRSSTTTRRRLAWRACGSITVVSTNRMR